MVKFPYRRETSRIFGVIYRPVAQVLVSSNKSDWKSVLMYIDSGADISLLPKEFGNLLNLDLNQNRNEIRGIGKETIPISLQNVWMRMESNEIKVKVAIALINEVPYILGRYDFFKFHKIVFEEYLKRVLIKKVG